MIVFLTHLCTVFGFCVTKILFGCSVKRRITFSLVPSARTDPEPQLTLSRTCISTPSPPPSRSHTHTLTTCRREQTAAIGRLVLEDQHSRLRRPLRKCLRSSFRTHYYYHYYYFNSIHQRKMFQRETSDSCCWNSLVETIAEIQHLQII